MSVTRFAPPLREGRQLCLFENLATATHLDEWLWCQSFDRQESSLQTIAPYASKLKSGTVQALIDLYSKPGDVVFDPFAGSGVIPFEAALGDRCAWANDLSPYAHCLTRGKLEAPRSERLALQQFADEFAAIEQLAATIDLAEVSAWIHDFFHPDTLREVIAAARVFQQRQRYFLLACLLGILHHVLPGCLSYPTNQQSPYLRRATYPPDRFPQLYAYRDLRSRLIAKIKRVYRQHRLPSNWDQRRFQVWQSDAVKVDIADHSVDVVISNPPHIGAFESMRDHRLRLWFLGCDCWRSIDSGLIAHQKTDRSRLCACFHEIARALKPKGYCVLLVSDVMQHGNHRGTAEQLAECASQHFTIETIYDQLPPKPANRLRGVGFDRILILRKAS